jgi:hypothetical protein
MKKNILALGLVLALVAVMVMPMAALAGTTTSVSGTLGATITVSAPSGITFSTFVVGINNANSINGTVSTTGATTWHVTAADSTNAGFMKKGSTPLTDELTICDTSGGTFVLAHTGITYSSPTTLALYAKQVVVGGDMAGTYSTTITFTGTVDN